MSDEQNGRRCKEGGRCKKDKENKEKKIWLFVLLDLRFTELTVTIRLLAIGGTPLLRPSK
jgi:hypothetical protein